VARNIRRVERALAKVGDDEKRLRGLIGQRREGLLLQARLHSLDKNVRLIGLRLADEQGEEVDVRLDPGLTVRENMERFFTRAAKGERGLGIVAARVQALSRELEAARQGVAPKKRVGRFPALPVPEILPAKYRKLKVQAYRSSDGFLIVRGRNAQANHQLLTQAASPFDYWLHAQDGPGAHVIIKRDFPAQEVPERTIFEAASLAALASHLKLADRGDVLLCLVKDVRPIKGAALGMVGVDKVLRTVRPASIPTWRKSCACKAIADFTSCPGGHTTGGHNVFARCFHVDRFPRQKSQLPAAEHHRPLQPALPVLQASGRMGFFAARRDPVL
jgi:hypothetical protein